MKMVVAVVRPEQLPAIKDALFAVEVRQFTVTTALGTAPRAEQRMYRGIEQQVALHQRIRLELAVDDAALDTVLGALREGAQAQGGHGKVFISELADVMTLWDGKRGSDSL
ncbi:MAG: P-II family nitrogen regulator [Myxococcales bacterium]|nr:P-II family nitrogen regulator [Myxococcales bacterium]